LIDSDSYTIVSIDVISLAGIIHFDNFEVSVGNGLSTPLHNDEAQLNDKSAVLRSDVTGFSQCPIPCHIIDEAHWNLLYAE